MNEYTITVTIAKNGEANPPAQTLTLMTPNVLNQDAMIDNLIDHATSVFEWAGEIVEYDDSITIRYATGQIDDAWSKSDSVTVKRDGVEMLVDASDVKIGDTVDGLVVTEVILPVE